MKTSYKIFALCMGMLTIAFGDLLAQDKPSPAASVSEKIKSGATVSINYSSPALKGRTMGKDVEPMEGKVWRAGANNATVFEVDKEVKIEGKALPAGKYAFFTLKNGDDWTLIFNKTWDTWGAFDYEKNKGEDALQVKVKSKKAASASERLTYTIDKSGKVSLLWGDLDVSFNVK
ncbi:DUF2911 domain-containing protein [Imperialibacter roseus]|uniref:DUF2911 domain-containing protein n=1 Tax=Imperialibacter roseus TaxID=1324217 RepID=A0ABZ0IKA3_9BACT|nr:DUF2911 domain-containing protein [Imperialibacter roseus]WOK05443.1 DUF2911 domain-containing protein [Imperialibacter roseus]|tara:strand:+ start:961 stop:1485 length:525 start_codon:yes stop_codon:yes gene_type:complete